jgi:flagellar motor switch protein FliM
VRDLANPNLLTLLSLEPLIGAAIFQLPLEIAFCAVELMMGGGAIEEHPSRPLTELELQLIRGILDRALPELRYAFEPVVATEPKIMSQESNPQYAQIAAPTDMVIVVAFDIRIESVSGTRHAVHPVLEPAAAPRGAVGDLAVRQQNSVQTWPRPASACRSTWARRP